MHNLYALWAIVIMSSVTFLLRVLPFVLFGKGKTPKAIEYLGKTLPYAVMAMLVVYCLKDTSFTALNSCLPQLISVAAVVILHIWKRNTLLSIVSGTIIYMLLTQLVFI